jgi:hypothetical protein
MFDGGSISGRRLYGALADETVVLGTATGSFNYYDATVWGGAGGTGINPAVQDSEWTITFDSTQRYIGFWWSAGNRENYLQLLNEDGVDLLSPEFSTDGVVNAVLDGNSCGTLGSYGDLTYPPETTSGTWERYCGNPNDRFRDGGSDAYFAPEPYAFVHLRFENGFRGVRFYGSGFEFDNVTVSETVPSTSDDEEAVSVIDIDANLPEVLVVDPRLNAKALPAITLESSTDAMICISQVSDSSGTALSGVNTLTVGRTSNTQNITESSGSNIWRFSGPRSDVQAQIPFIQIQGISGAALVPSGSKWIQIHLTSNTADAGCDDNQVNRFVELRALDLTQIVRKGTIQLKN